MKKLNDFLTKIMWVFLGTFTGQSIYRIYDYMQNPELYELSETPWYTPLLVYGIVAVVVIAICALIKLAIKNKIDPKK